MILQQTTISACLAVAVSLACATLAQAQAGAESFTATATVKTVSGAQATAPVTITIDRKMPEAESDKLVAAFKSGGAAGLRKALYNYMHGVGLDTDVRDWFEPRSGRRRGGRHHGRRGDAHVIPRTTVPPNLIERSIA